MNDAFFDFEWTVAPRYVWQEWVDTDGSPLPIPSHDLLGLDSPAAVELTWNHAGEHGRKYGPVLSAELEHLSELRRYRPMHREHAALFREFAEVDYASRDAVQAFASRYGLLGLPPQSQSISFRTPEGRHGQNFAHGEPLLQWALEVCLMREGLRVAGRKRTADASRRLKWLFDRNLQHVQARLSFGGAGQPTVLLEPLTLIAALWLQLALAVTGEKRFVACKFCRRLFEISTEQTGFRSHREFCTNSCKTKDYRKRKRTALAFGAAGLPMTDISERTETELATVRSWLAAAKTDGRKARKGGA